MIPKGKLLIIGGHEDKGPVPGENLNIDHKRKPKTRFEILGSLIPQASRGHQIIEIIASASSIPLEMEEIYIKSYKDEGFTHVGFINVENEQDTHNPDSLKRIQNAHAVFFTGGDQVRLLTLLGKTELLQAVIRKYNSDTNFIVAGTSAGAMALPETIIASGIIGAALYKEDLHIAAGFGLIQNVIIDTHFIRRGRFARLAHAVTIIPSCLGIGLEENTAVLITGGNHAACLGSGMVVIIDGSKIGITNIDTARDSIPVVVENLVVSILAEGSSYDIIERKFYLNKAKNV